MGRDAELIASHSSFAFGKGISILFERIARGYPNQLNFMAGDELILSGGTKF